VPALGAAECYRTAAAVLGMLHDCALRRDETGRAAEVLTPIIPAPPSTLTLAAAATVLVASPDSAATPANSAVRSSSISPRYHRTGPCGSATGRLPERDRRCYDRVLRYRVSETAKKVRRIPADHARDPHA
jgi:hypothetical protein